MDMKRKLGRGVAVVGAGMSKFGMFRDRFVGASYTGFVDKMAHSGSLERAINCGGSCVVRPASLC